MRTYTIMIYIFDIPYVEHTLFCCNGWIYYRLYIKICCLLTSFTVQVLHYVALETSNKNILYLSTIGFKAQNLWGHVQIKFNEMQVFERRGNWSSQGKTSQSREHNQKTQHAESGNQTQQCPHWWLLCHHWSLTKWKETMIGLKVKNVCAHVNNLI